MANGGSSFVRNFGVRLVVLEGDSFVRATQQVVQANQAQANSLNALGRAQRGAGEESSKLVGGLRGLAANIAILDGPLGGIASRVNAFGTAYARLGGILILGSAAITAAVFTLRRAIPVVSELEQHIARVQGVMQATGGQIGLTEQQIESFSQQIGGSTLASINEVRQAFVELATSGTVFGDTAVRTIQTAQDLAQVFGGTLAQNMDLLIRTSINVRSGVEGLRERFGVQLPDALQRSIQAMQDLGNTQGAMDQLLEFLSGRVGGQGVLGATNTLAGSFQQLTESVQRFLELFTGGPGAQGLKDFLQTTAKEIRAITGFIDGVEAKGGWLKALIGDTSTIDRVLALLEAMRGGVGAARESLSQALRPGHATQAAGEAASQFARELFAQSPAALTGDLDRLLTAAEQELGITEQVAEIRRRMASEENFNAAQRFNNALKEFRTEEQRRQQVQEAATARQRELAIQAQQKRETEAALELAKERGRVEDANQRKMEQELPKIESIIERLKARLIDLRGGSTFQQIEARESGTSAFLINRREIQALADRGDRLKAFQDQLQASNEFIQESLREQQTAISRTARALSSELVGAWKSVTAAAIEGGDVTKAALLSITNLLQGVAERVATNFLTAALTQATTPGTARFLGFAHGGSFSVGEATGSSIIHMLPPQGGIFAGRAQSGLDFMVPGGSGATDSVPVSFLATPGERVSVTPPGARGTGADLNLNINVTGGSPDQQAMLEVFGSHLLEQAVSRSIGRTLDLVTRDRTVRRIVRGGRR